MSAAAQNFSQGIDDLVSGFKKWRIWTAFAWEEAKSTYKRSLVGVLWIAASFAVFVLAKILVFGTLLSDGTSPSYLSAYLVVGFFAWQFFNSIVSNATSVFISGEAWLRNDPIPLSLFAYKAVFRASFDLLLTALVTAVAVAWLGFGFHFHSFMVLAAIIAYLFNAVWVVLLLGLICTRFRDVAHLVQTAMRVLFFLTPIFWMPEQFDPKVFEVLWWNPFAHFIWILRDPVLDQEFAHQSWVYVGVLTVVGWGVTIAAFAAFRRRVVFWI